MSLGERAAYGGGFEFMQVEIGQGGKWDLRVGGVEFWGRGLK